MSKPQTVADLRKKNRALRAELEVWRERAEVSQRAAVAAATERDAALGRASAPQNGQETKWQQELDAVREQVRILREVLGLQMLGNVQWRK